MSNQQWLVPAYYGAMPPPTVISIPQCKPKEVPKLFDRWLITDAYDALEVYCSVCKRDYSHLDLADLIRVGKCPLPGCSNVISDELKMVLSVYVLKFQDSINQHKLQTQIMLQQSVASLDRMIALSNELLKNSIYCSDQKPKPWWKLWK